MSLSVPNAEQQEWILKPTQSHLPLCSRVLQPLSNLALRFTGAAAFKCKNKTETPPETKTEPPCPKPLDRGGRPEEAPAPPPPPRPSWVPLFFALKNRTNLSLARPHRALFRRFTLPRPPASSSKSPSGIHGPVLGAGPRPPHLLTPSRPRRVKRRGANEDESDKSDKSANAAP